LTHLRRNYELAFDSPRIESHDDRWLTSGEEGAYRRAIADVTDLRNLSQPERMQHVLRMLETRDSVPVSELSETFAVSEVTVRSDLTALARQGLVARVRGGVRALQQGQSEVGFDLRLRLEVDRKRAIAKRAATMIGESEAVAIDASTTGYYLALELRARRELVVVTNGLLVATALADAPGISVIVPGGTLRLSAMSLVGDFGTDMLRSTRINKGFLGARGLSIERGLMDLNPEEVRIKQEMADACEQVWGIIDGTKWHRSALLSFVSMDDLTGIVTDPSAPTDEVEAWRGAGVDVIIAQSGPMEPLPVRPRDLRHAAHNDGATS
jgi:DeoR/GlpR family transcriptional regulator of sugar metabolism